MSEVLCPSKKDAFPSTHGELQRVELEELADGIRSLAAVYLNGQNGSSECSTHTIYWDSEAGRYGYNGKLQTPEIAQAVVESWASYFSEPELKKIGEYFGFSLDPVSVRNDFMQCR